LKEKIDLNNEYLKAIFDEINDFSQKIDDSEFLKDLLSFYYNFHFSVEKKINIFSIIECVTENLEYIYQIEVYIYYLYLKKKIYYKMSKRKQF